MAYRCNKCDFYTTMWEAMDEHLNGAHRKGDPMSDTHCERHKTLMRRVTRPEGLAATVTTWECDACIAERRPSVPLYLTPQSTLADLQEFAKLHKLDVINCWTRDGKSGTWTANVTRGSHMGAGGSTDTLADAINNAVQGLTK